ncbi:hypothetical protein VIGAN_08183100 [Vigna angularis var. angularis]|uniref:Uncharacterized protein n=1 Tax=Vigna angularis var. angularis TaxID=157739 RepID=A0A0S3SQP8_PHAAN|nr:hypothetical protein VIGAN_08183100 [Vigna angularis var. angularis]
MSAAPSIKDCSFSTYLVRRGQSFQKKHMDKAWFICHALLGKDWHMLCRNHSSNQQKYTGLISVQAFEFKAVTALACLFSILYIELEYKAKFTWKKKN